MSEEYDPFQPTEEDYDSAKFTSQSKRSRSKKSKKKRHGVSSGIDISLIQLPPEPSKNQTESEPNEKDNVPHGSDTSTTPGMVDLGHTEIIVVDSDEEPPEEITPPTTTVVEKEESPAVPVPVPPLKKAATLIAMATAARSIAPTDQSTKKKFGFGTLNKSPPGHPTSYATQKPEPKTLSKISFALKKPRFRPLSQFSNEPIMVAEVKETAQTEKVAEVKETAQTEKVAEVKGTAQTEKESESIDNTNTTPSVKAEQPQEALINSEESQSLEKLGHKKDLLVEDTATNERTDSTTTVVDNKKSDILDTDTPASVSSDKLDIGKLSKNDSFVDTIDSQSKSREHGSSSSAIKESSRSNETETTESRKDRTKTATEGSKYSSKRKSRFSEEGDRVERHDSRHKSSRYGGSDGRDRDREDMDNRHSPKRRGRSDRAETDRTESEGRHSSKRRSRFSDVPEGEHQSGTKNRGRYSDENVRSEKSHREDRHSPKRKTESSEKMEDEKRSREDKHLPKGKTESSEKAGDDRKSREDKHSPKRTAESSEKIADEKRSREDKHSPKRMTESSEKTGDEKKSKEDEHSPKRTTESSDKIGDEKRRRDDKHSPKRKVESSEKIGDYKQEDKRNEEDSFTLRKEIKDPEKEKVDVTSQHKTSKIDAKEKKTSLLAKEEEEAFPLRKDYVEQISEDYSVADLKPDLKEAGVGDGSQDIKDVLYAPPRSVYLAQKDTKQPPIEGHVKKKPSSKGRLGLGLSFIAEAFGDVEKKIQEELKLPETSSRQVVKSALSEEVIESSKGSVTCVAMGTKEKITDETAKGLKSSTIEGHSEGVVKENVTGSSHSSSSTERKIKIRRSKWDVTERGSEQYSPTRMDENEYHVVGTTSGVVSDVIDMKNTEGSKMGGAKGEREPELGGKIREEKLGHATREAELSGKEIKEKLGHTTREAELRGKEIEQKPGHMIRKAELSIEKEVELRMTKTGGELNGKTGQADVCGNTEVEHSDKVNPKEMEVSKDTNAVEVSEVRKTVNDTDKVQVTESKKKKTVDKTTPGVEVSASEGVEEEGGGSDSSSTSSSSSSSSGGSESSSDEEDEGGGEGGSSSDSSSSSSDSSSESSESEAEEEPKVNEEVKEGMDVTVTAEVVVVQGAKEVVGKTDKHTLPEETGPCEKGDQEILSSVDSKTCAPVADEIEPVNEHTPEEESQREVQTFPESIAVENTEKTNERDRSSVNSDIIKDNSVALTTEESGTAKTEQSSSDKNPEIKTPKDPEKTIEKSSSQGQKSSSQGQKRSRSSSKREPSVSRDKKRDSKRGDGSPSKERKRESSVHRDRQKEGSVSRDRRRASSKDRRKDSSSKDRRRERSLSRDRRKDRSLSRDRRKDGSLSRDRRKDRSLSRDRRRDRSLSRDRRKDRSLSRERRKDRSLSRERRKDRSLSRDRRKDRSLSRERRKDRSLSRDRRKDRSLSRERRKDRSLSRERRIESVRRRPRSSSRDRRRERRSHSRERRRSPARERRRRSRDRSSSYDRIKRRRSRSRERRSLSRGRRSRSRGRRSRSRDRHSRSSRRRHSPDRRPSPEYRDSDRTREYDRDRKSARHSSHDERDHFRRRRSVSADGGGGRGGKESTSGDRDDSHATTRQMNIMPGPAIGIPLPGEALSPFGGGKIPPPPPPPMGAMFGGPPLDMQHNEQNIDSVIVIGDTGVVSTATSYGMEPSLDRVSSTTNDKVMPEVENVQTIQVLGSGRSSANFQSSAGPAARKFPSILQESHKPLSFSITTGQRKPLIASKKKALDIFEEDSNGSSENGELDRVLALPRMDVSPTHHPYTEEQPQNLISIPTSHDVDAKSRYHVDSSISSSVKTDHKVQKSNLISVVLSELQKTPSTDWVDSSTGRNRSDSATLEAQKGSPVTPSRIPTLIGGKAGSPKLLTPSPATEVSSTSNEPFLSDTEDMSYLRFSEGETRGLKLSAKPMPRSSLPPKPHRVVSQENITQANIVPAPRSSDSSIEPYCTRTRGVRRRKHSHIEAEPLGHPAQSPSSLGFDTQSLLAESSQNVFGPVTNEQTTESTIPDAVSSETEALTKDTTTESSQNRFGQVYFTGLPADSSQNRVGLVSFEATDGTIPVSVSSETEGSIKTRQTEPGQNEVYSGSVESGLCYGSGCSFTLGSSAPEEPLLQDNREATFGLRETKEDKKSSLSCIGAQQLVIGTDTETQKTQGTTDEQSQDTFPPGQREREEGGEEEDEEAKPEKRGSRRGSSRKGQQMEPQDNVESEGSNGEGLTMRRRSSRLKNLEQQSKDPTEGKSKDDKSGKGKRNKKRKEEESVAISEVDNPGEEGTETEPPPPPPPPPPSKQVDTKQDFILPDNVPLRSDDTPTSSHSGVSSAAMSPGSAGSGKPPEKVKSRWRRWSELETKQEVDPLAKVQEEEAPPPPPPVAWEGAEKDTGDDKEPVTTATTAVVKEELLSDVKEEEVTKETEIDEEDDAPPPPPPPPPPVAEVTSCVKEEQEVIEQEVEEATPEPPPPPPPPPPAPGPPTEDVKIPEKPPYFENILDHIFLCERKKSKARKEARRMVCDCSPPCKEDRVFSGSLPCGEDCLNRMLMIECGSRCPCGDQCTNKRFQRHQYADVAPFYAGSKGWGMQAKSDIPIGTFLMEYVGEVLDFAEFQKRANNYSTNQHFYFMALNSDEIVDATSKGNISRFINHSCDPSAETQKWTVNGQLRIGFFTVKEIAAGDEITFDYQFENYGQEAQKCYCGATNCRGFLGTKKTRLHDDIEDEVCTEAETEQRRKRKKDKKKRPRIFDDILLSEEIQQMMELEGMRRRDHVLELARLMVRAESSEHRADLLKVLQATKEPNCLRLVLDYQGLQLLWSWMVDVPRNACDLKMQILQALKLLPITNRTILKDSKILSMVQKWAALPPREGKKDETREGEGSQTPRSASEAERDESLPTTPVTPGSLTAPQYEGGAFIHKKRRLLQSLRTTEGEASGSDSDMSESKAKLEAEGYVSCSEDKTGDTSQDGSDTGVLAGLQDEKMTAVIELATELLNLWKDLKESFKIPKIKVEERKKRERELDKEGGYSKGYSRLSHHRWRDARKRQAGSPERPRDEKRRRDSDRESLDSRIRKVLQPTPPKGPKMSKEEHRKLFELQVKAEDTLKKQAELEQQQQIELQQQQYYQQQQQQQQQQDPSFAFYQQQQQQPQAATYQDPSVYQDPSYAGYDPSLYTQGQYILQPDGTYLPAQPASVAEAVVAGLVVDPVSQQPLQSSGYTGTQFVDPITQLVSPTYQQSYATQTSQEQQASTSDVYAVPQPSTQQSAQVIQMVQGGQAVQQVYYTAQTGQQVIVQQPVVPQIQPAAQIVQQVPGQQAQVITVTDPTAIQQLNDATSLLLVNEKLAQIAPVATNDVTSTTATVSRDPRDPPPPPPSPPPKPKSVRLPPNWKTAKDAEGKVYYYHTVTRQTQWDPPPWDQGEDDEDKMDFGTPTYDENEPKMKKKKETNTASADSSSEIAKKIKDQFRTKMSKYVVTYLNPFRKTESKKGRIVNHEDFKHLARKMSKHMVKYLSPFRKPDCKLGRISSTDDFKHLARKLTHAVLDKELKYCRHVEDLEVNESVKTKAKEFVKKYMSKCGTVYKSKGDDSPP